MSIAVRRVSEIITDVEEDKLEVRPFFQRRQVWTNSDKELFIDTVLRNYPFPEVFVATGTIDLNGIKRKKWLVDGQQRITTLREYIRGSDDLLCKTIVPYARLTEEQQIAFLDYEVAIRDLGTIKKEEIQEIFRRINSTDYALKTMEVLNAMYSGAYKKYCDALSKQPFFQIHHVFPAASKKRMYDITFCVILVTTLLSGYYRRDERNAEFLERYNDEFPQQEEIQRSLDKVFEFVEACEFPPRSRAWKQTDLLTLLVEVHSLMITENIRLKPQDSGRVLGEFFEEVDQLFANKTAVVPGELPVDRQNAFTYLLAATKATNDKYARMDRATIISQLLRGTGESGASASASTTSAKMLKQKRKKSQA